ncbi:magnesium and cobalt transport protein CorA [Streptomyces sp. NBC_01387]|uniref:magnesium and cobalt transport protein CorA n=1 Tax=unclassified Streptomyces TaxID=2593676 RepID=UPI0020256E4F|nr:MULTISPECIES: magnesium and cobalt transport protein CorA [unclassified Streptomyces]WSC21267.1 magnesium and cobalt transport protein CorA [Streptomyces sp. NBC_01766]
MTTTLHTLRRAVRRPHPRPVDLSHPARSPLGSAVVNCVVYRDGVRQPGDGPAGEAVRQVREAGSGFVWIGLHEPLPSELAELGRLLGLHPLTVEDALRPHPRPKLDVYGSTLTAVFKTVCYVEHQELTTTSEIVDTGELVVFTGTDFVLTVRRGGCGSLGPLREHLEASPEQLAKGPAAVLHAMADHVVEEYAHVADAVRDDIDAVESTVFSQQAARGDAGRIYQLKRELLEFRRAVAPLDRPLQQLIARPEGLISQDIRTYFRDVAGRLARITEQITAYDGLLDSIFQAHLAQVGVAQNEDMRKISAWASIAAVPTMVCGFYGMNFEDMPGLHWRYGYPLALVGMVAVCLLMRRGFRRNGWL